MSIHSVISLPKNDIYCRVWGDETVVYNQLSGETHLLEGMGAYVFKCLSENALTRHDLLEAMLNTFELDFDFTMEVVLDNLLADYLKLNLLTVTENNSL